MLKLVVNNEYLTFDCDKKVMDFLCQEHPIQCNLERIVSRKGIVDRLEGLWNKYVISYEGNNGVCKYKVRVGK